MDSYRQIKMEKVIILSCMFAACSAVFFFPSLRLPNSGQNVMNVCVYSMDPNRYQPKCFLCPSTVYANVLQACLNAAAIPRNITFAQARCLEQNCAINRGKRSVDARQPENLLEEFGTLLPLDEDKEEENAEDQQNGEQETVIEQENGLQDEDQENDEQEMAIEQKNGLQVAQQHGYKVVGTEEFMASDVEDYLDYSDMVD